ncbi:MAG: coiled-coil domain-containing protein [Pseudomonadota bacterium]
MDERVTKLESDVAAIGTDVALIRSNYATKLDVNELRNDLHIEFGKVRAETHVEFGKARGETQTVSTDLSAEIGKLRDEMRVEFGKMRIEMRDIARDVLKWIIGPLVVVVVVMYGMVVSFGNTMRALAEARMPVPAAVAAPPAAPAPALATPADAVHK